MASRKKKQLEVAGTEKPDNEIPEVTEAAIQYREIRDARMALTKREGPAREALANVLTKNNIHHPATYNYIDNDGEERVVAATPTKVKITVRKVTSKQASDEDPEVVGDE